MACAPRIVCGTHGVQDGVRLGGASAGALPCRLPRAARSRCGPREVPACAHERVRPRSLDQRVALGAVARRACKAKHRLPALAPQLGLGHKPREIERKALDALARLRTLNRPIAAACDFAMKFCVEPRMVDRRRQRAKQLDHELGRKAEARERVTRLELAEQRMGHEEIPSSRASLEPPPVAKTIATAALRSAPCIVACGTARPACRRELERRTPQLVHADRGVDTNDRRHRGFGGIVRGRLLRLLADANRSIRLGAKSQDERRLRRVAWPVRTRDG